MAAGQSEVVTVSTVVLEQAAQAPVATVQTPSVPEPSALDLHVLASAVHPVVAAQTPFWQVFATTAQLSVAAGVEAAPTQASAKQVPVAVAQYIVASPPVVVA